MFYTKRRPCNQIHEACGHVARQLIHFSVCVIVLCFWCFVYLCGVKCICYFRESHMVCHCCEWHLEVDLSIRSVCLFLFSVPSQRWLIACFSAWFGVFQHMFSSSGLPTYSFPLFHFFVFATSSSPPNQWWLLKRAYMPVSHFPLLSPLSSPAPAVGHSRTGAFPKVHGATLLP